MMQNAELLHPCPIPSLFEYGAMREPRFRGSKYLLGAADRWSREPWYAKGYGKDTPLLFRVTDSSDSRDPLIRYEEVGPQGCGVRYVLLGPRAFSGYFS